jgi:hypothetical protein
MKKLLAAGIVALGMAAGACEMGPSDITADPQVTVQFFRLCSPFRARLEITVAEIGGAVGITVTSMNLSMKDIDGVVRFSRALTSADLVAAMGSNHIDPARSRILIQDGTYPGNVDTMDSTAIVEVTIVDDEGGTINRTVNVGFQRDGC